MKFFFRNIFIKTFIFIFVLFNFSCITGFGIIGGYSGNFVQTQIVNFKDEKTSQKNSDYEWLKEADKTEYPNHCFVYERYKGLKWFMAFPVFGILIPIPIFIPYGLAYEKAFVKDGNVYAIQRNNNQINDLNIGFLHWAAPGRTDVGITLRRKGDPDFTPEFERSICKDDEP